ncbi:hypothetical protein J0Q64_001760 [Salmonella enterica subsp. enterica serovar Newport]|nr:hypothetical protein [Salmonella enterica subsp. enterica serovar Newport]EHJ5406371.1 hypothetical protein [Salmonella enterica subsp. enterica serovar Wedding]
MIIVGKGVLYTVGTSDKGDGSIAVKTDGITITGDGNSTPLALGPGEMDSIGGYIWAYCVASDSHNFNNTKSNVNRGDIVPGSTLAAAFYSKYGMSSTANRGSRNGIIWLSGSWQILGQGDPGKENYFLVRRIA